jgi:hypothetical protein
MKYERCLAVLRTYISGNNTEGERYRALIIYFPFKDTFEKADLIVWKLEWVRDDIAIVQITYQVIPDQNGPRSALFPQRQH